MTRAEPHGGVHALFLMFELDGERYALDAADIEEVLPLAATKAVPGAPEWIAGLLMRSGQPVPVIDVPMLALGRRAHALRSTRCGRRAASCNPAVRARAHDRAGVSSPACDHHGGGYRRLRSRRSTPP